LKLKEVLDMHTIAVLDHGFVSLKNLAGPTRRLSQLFDASDVDPANAARMSFNQTDSNRTIEQDIKLSRYLMKNWHTSPFEMIEVWLEMKMPIFVARQFIRHRTTSINEVSGRYVTLPAEWYIPETVGAKADDKKQGQTTGLDEITAQNYKAMLNTHCEKGYEYYTTLIANGVAPEHARLFLSLNHYTHWLWKQNLSNMMHFLRLRDHNHAQIEAQLYAKAVDLLLRAQLPHTMNLYDEYRKLPT
jgi:thymidylate synthase (FAD)